MIDDELERAYIDSANDLGSGGSSRVGFVTEHAHVSGQLPLFSTRE